MTYVTYVFWKTGSALKIISKYAFKHKNNLYYLNKFSGHPR